MKEAIADQVHLTPPITDEPFVIITDPSLYGIGAALCQLTPSHDNLNLLGFYSKSLNPTQQKWDTRGREAYAIKAALERWSDMITLHEVIIFTDQSSL